MQPIRYDYVRSESRHSSRVNRIVLYGSFRKCDKEPYKFKILLFSRNSTCNQITCISSLTCTIILLAHMITHTCRLKKTFIIIFLSHERIWWKHLERNLYFTSNTLLSHNIHLTQVLRKLFNVLLFYTSRSVMQRIRWT